MIRTTFSCMLLFSSLLFVSRLMEQGNADERLSSRRSGSPSLPKTKSTLSAPQGHVQPVSQEEPQFRTTANFRRRRFHFSDSGPQQQPQPAPQQPTATPRVPQPPPAQPPTPLADPMVETFPTDSILVEPESESATSTRETTPEQPANEPAPPAETRTAPDFSITPVPSPTPEAGLSLELESLRERLRFCLAQYYSRHESVNDYSPWGIMHAAIAYGVDTQIFVNGQRVNSIGYLCWNGSCRGMRLMQLQRGGLHLPIGPGVQGHAGQFLAILAQSKVKRDYPLRIQDRELTVADLIEYEKATCRSGTELTFKLIALSHYLDTNDTWKADDGETWSIPRLIREEIAAPVIGAACGGSHRLSGYAYAVRKREKKGEPIDGQWLRARKYLDAYHDYAFSLQNDDGSFSTEWFRGRGNSPDPERRLDTTGHVLEWLVYSLPEDQLTDARVVKAVEYLTNLLTTGDERNWEIGPKGHALHALVMYDERVFGLAPGNREQAYSVALQKRALK